jgi:hypothetical protein
MFGQWRVFFDAKDQLDVIICREYVQQQIHQSFRVFVARVHGWRCDAPVGQNNLMALIVQ